MKRRFALACLFVGLGLLGFQSIPNACAAEKELKKLHVLLVLDTNSDSLRESIVQDKKYLTDALTRGIPPDRVSINYLDGDKVTSRNVFDFFESNSNIKGDGTEALMCYFSGHGGTVKDTKQHKLLLTGNRNKREFLDRDDLRKVMQKKNPALLLLITDSCSEYLTSDIVPRRMPPVPKLERMSAGYSKLFFQARGVVDINASYEGSLSWCDDQGGGIFTRTLAMKLADCQDDAKVTWPTFYSVLKMETDKTYHGWRADEIKRGTNDKDLKNQESQVPQAYNLPDCKVGLGVERTRDGIKIAEVQKGSAAERAEFSTDEFIVTIDGKPVQSLDDFDHLIETALGASHVTIDFEVKGKDGQVRRRTVKMAG